MDLSRPLIRLRSYVIFKIVFVMIVSYEPHCFSALTVDPSS